MDQVRLELTTPALSTRCSNQLSYWSTTTAYVEDSAAPVNAQNARHAQKSQSYRTGLGVGVTPEGKWVAKNLIFAGTHHLSGVCAQRENLKSQPQAFRF